MNGILVGVLATLATLAALRVLRFAAWRLRRGRCGGRGYFARRVLRRLDASPDQEQVLREELETLRQALWAARRGFLDSREELAQLLEASTLDVEALARLGAQRIAPLEALRQRAAAGLARFHASLDARQRHVLGEMLRSAARAHG